MITYLQHFQFHLVTDSYKIAEYLDSDKITGRQKMKAYSHDLRIRIFNYSLSHSIRETAKIFQVSPNTASGDLKVPQNWRSESGELFSSNFLNLSF